MDTDQLLARVRAAIGRGLVASPMLGSVLISGDAEAARRARIAGDSCIRIDGSGPQFDLEREIALVAICSWMAAPYRKHLQVLAFPDRSAPGEYEVVARREDFDFDELRRRGLVLPARER